MDKKHLIYISVLSIILFLIIGMLVSYNNILEEEDAEINSTINEFYVEGRPTIIVGDDIEYPPYSFIDENGNPAGFNLELITAVGNALGYNVEIKLDTWTNTVKALENEEIDLISGMFKSEERAKSFSFSIRTAVTGGEIFSTLENSIDNIEDLKNKQVVVQKDDIIHEYLMKEDSEKNLNIEFIPVDTIHDAFELLENGEYQYAGLLKIPGSYIKNYVDLDRIYPQNIQFSLNDYSFAALKKNENLIYMMNGGLSLIKSSGKYDEIYDKWLGVYEGNSYKDFIREYFLIIIGVLFLILFLLIIIIVLRFIVKRRTEDLTESNKELQISEEKNRAIISAIPDLIFIFNKDGIIEDTLEEDDNLLIEKSNFKGLKIQDILSKDLSQIVSEKIHNTINEDITETFKYKTSIKEKIFKTYSELEGFSKDNEEVFEMRMVKLRDNQVLAISRDITNDEINQKKIQYLSFHDQLTGLYNRRFFEEELKRLDTKRMLPLSLIMTDVNGLKLINDSFGHDAGDNLLKEFSSILKNVSREEDIVCRIGGDEFIILLPQMKNYYLKDMVERVKEKLDNKNINKLGISASFGYSTKENDEEDIKEILKKAEDLMYRNKFVESPYMKNKTIDKILNILHDTDEWERTHSEKVSQYCEILGKELNFSEKDLEEVRLSGLLHDIGKITLKDTFMEKGHISSDSGKKELKRHSEVGYRILNTYKNLYNISEYILFHHENWDGTGYPKGLAGEEIPIKSRIISIANYYDTATRNRPNKRNLTKEEACKELKTMAGTCFDPKLVDIFIEKILKK
ncbi:MAG: transporter substrate-binding domain-containing protein [Bacillota bacterium]|nr:transporter substrate-binding domain-containing protein [Bacillota bacterium]